MIHKRPSVDNDKVIVTFEIPGSVWAERIHLVGDFNDWDPQNLPLRHTREEMWQIELELDRGRAYHFRYLIDGHHWRSEWHADLHAAGSDGTFDSVVITQLPPAA
jgi:1,4-alpha-glucan branching enzyme